MTDQHPKNPAQIAETYVKSFQDGEEFMPPSEGLVDRTTPDPQALLVLERHLWEDSSEVRANIVDLLADLGAQCADPSNTGIAAIKDRRILELLVKVGMAKPDLAREKAMQHLRTMVLRSDLGSWSQDLTKVIEERPTEDALLLVAKARAVQAREGLEKLANDPEWSGDRPLSIARAALGDAALMGNYLQDLQTAVSRSDIEGFEEAIEALSRTGGPEALKAVAEQLRTPLIAAVPKAGARSLRLVVLEGLAYAFPDEIVLYPDNIIEEEDYVAAERFCERELGAVYNDPRPPFLTYGPFPSGATKR
jgi:hypothetical protein